MSDPSIIPAGYVWEGTAVVRYELVGDLDRQDYLSTGGTWVIRAAVGPSRHVREVVRLPGSMAFEDVERVALHMANTEDATGAALHTLAREVAALRRELLGLRADRVAARLHRRDR